MLLMKPGYSPTKLLVAASICCASLVSVPTPAAAACQAGQAGCVLPVGTAAPPPLETTTTTTTTAPVYDDVDDGKSWLPIILGLLALGALAYFLIFDDDDDPESP
jgi:hypothetical protein